MSRAEIYGYWIGADESYIAEYEDHHGKGQEILQEVHGVEDADELGYTDVCCRLFNLGYVRVINHSYDDGHDVEYNGKVPHSKYQKQYISEARYKDVVDHERRRLESD